MKVPDNVSDPPALLFGIGNSSSIYGFYVSGDGAVDLGMLQKQGIDAGNTSSDTWTSDNLDISPVYIYKKDYYQRLNEKDVDIGIETSAGPLYIENGTVDSVTAQYVKENQLLEDMGYFDAIRKTDGEILLVYGQDLRYAFNVNGNLNNSVDNNTGWETKNGVFIIGTFDDAFTWSAPDAYQIENTNDPNQYAMMVMSGVEFLSSIYDPLTENIIIFVRCIEGDAVYIGAAILAVYSLMHDDVMLCTPVDTNNRSFLWRPPVLEDSFVNDEGKFWTDNKNIVNDGISYDPVVSTLMPDEFIRVMGSLASGSQIHNNDEVGIISTSELPDGTYILFYDTEAGSKALFSSDNGVTWHESGIIWARNGRASILVGSYVIYITASGIEAIQTDYAHFYIARDLAAGIQDPGTEQDLQDSLDILPHTLIGSGVIDPQRLSGYISSKGVVKVFFYDQNQLLKCIESRDQVFEWNVAKNF